MRKIKFRIHDFLILLFLILLYAIPFLSNLSIFILGVILIGLRIYLNKKNHVFYKGIQIFISFSLMLGCIYLIQTQQTLQKITSSSLETYETHVLVLKESSIRKLKDLNHKKIGYLETSLSEDSQEVLSTLKNREIEPKGYQSIESLSHAFYQKEIDSLILEEFYRFHIETYYPNFMEEVRVIKTYSRKEETKLDVSNPTLSKTLTLYVSGIDKYGLPSTVSRSDVNLLVTINPNTFQILITSIPRDFYVPLNRNQQYDKLTHTGLFGIKESMATLSQYFGIKIDGYARINFTGLIKIVDALNGVEVYSPYSFKTRFGSYQIKEGYNKLDGKKALAFVRERYALPNGDYDRGLNQQRLLTALIDKVVSPSILLNYSNLLLALRDSFETSLSMDLILAYIQKQIRDLPSWEILHYQVKGQQGYDWTYSYPNHKLFVIYPDQKSVQKVQEMIHAMEKNTKLKDIATAISL